MESTQLIQYLPVIMLTFVALAVIGGMMLGSVILGKKGRRPAIKDTPYECGMIPIGESHNRFSVRFYLVAMLFVLFDIEIVFLYPWAVVYKEMLGIAPHQIFGAMLTFLFLLSVGYVYAFKKGAFDWHRP